MGAIQLTLSCFFYISTINLKDISVNENLWQGFNLFVIFVQQILIKKIRNESLKAS